jgi:hypothetical protein
MISLSLVRTGVLAASVFLLVGCGGSVRSASVTGRVTVNGEAAEGVYVVFHKIGDRVGPSHPASARTHNDGTLSAALEPGEYAITVFWPEVTVEESATVEGEDVFRGRFSERQKPVAKTTISAGDNALPPIELKFELNVDPGS